MAARYSPSTGIFDRSKIETAFLGIPPFPVPRTTWKADFKAPSQSTTARLDSTTASSEPWTRMPQRSRSSGILNPRNTLRACTAAPPRKLDAWSVAGTNVRELQAPEESRREEGRERDQSGSSRGTYSVAVVVPLCRNDTSPLSAFRPSSSPRSSPPQSRRADTVPLTRTQARAAAPSGKSSVGHVPREPREPLEPPIPNARRPPPRGFRPIFARDRMTGHRWALDKRDPRPSMVIEGAVAESLLERP